MTDKDFATLKNMQSNGICDYSKEKSFGIFIKYQSNTTDTLPLSISIDEFIEYMEFTSNSSQNMSLLDEIQLAVAEEKSDLDKETKSKIISEKFKNRSVTTTYNSEMKMEYKILSVDFSRTPLSVMNEDVSDVDLQINFVQYLSAKYKCQLQNKSQPLFVATKNGTDKVYLVPEMCHVTNNYTSTGKTICSYIKEAITHVINLQSLLTLLGYSKWNNMFILRETFIAREYHNYPGSLFNNQRLEILGDAILEIASVEWLFKNLTTAKEGTMTKLKHLVTNNDYLSLVGRNLGFQNFVLGKAYIKQLADCVEAIIAAIYFDQGLQAAKDFVVQRILKDAQEMLLKEISKPAVILNKQTFETPSLRPNLTESTLARLTSLKKDLGVEFSNNYLLLEAITSTSSHHVSNFQRLEFFGDAVVKFLIVLWLYQTNQTSQEGDLSDKKSLYVSNKGMLVKSAEKLGLEKYIIIQDFPNKNLDSDLAHYNSLMSDVYEAVIGAVYYEHGILEFEKEQLDVKNQLIRRSIIDLIDSEMNKKTKIAKGELQSIVQRNFEGILPIYEKVGSAGPLFICSISIGGILVAYGQGLNKKDAEMDAASRALTVLEFGSKMKFRLDNKEDLKKSIGYFTELLYVPALAKENFTSELEKNVQMRTIILDKVKPPPITDRLSLMGIGYEEEYIKCRDFEFHDQLNKK